MQNKIHSEELHHIFYIMNLHMARVLRVWPE